jgi:DNA-binding CsgD family transcriptional regulator
MLACYGQLGEALACAQESVEVATEVDNRLWIVGGHCSLGDAYLAVLDPEHAVEVLDRGVALARTLGSTVYLGNVTASLARAHLLCGDLAAAQRTIAHVDVNDPAPRSLEQRRLMWVSAQVALAAQDPVTALRVTDRLKATASDPSGEGAIPALDALRADALLALGRADEAYTALVVARRQAEEQGHRLLLWQIDRSLVQVHAARRRRGEARLALRNATETIDALADSIPQLAVRERFRTTALACLPAVAGPTPLQAAKEAAGGLSRREREIADLVAHGSSNADIASALTISVRTVETHIANIYAKLGMNSRVQLTAWAIDHQSLDLASPRTRA